MWSIIWDNAVFSLGKFSVIMIKVRLQLPDCRSIECCAVEYWVASLLSLVAARSRSLPVPRWVGTWSGLQPWPQALVEIGTSGCLLHWPQHQIHNLSTISWPLRWKTLSMDCLKHDVMISKSFNLLFYIEFHNKNPKIKKKATRLCCWFFKAAPHRSAVDSAWKPIRF